jgi:hypothetical protein
VESIKARRLSSEMEKIKCKTDERSTRQCKEGKFKEKARTKLGMSTFVTDGARL